MSNNKLADNDALEHIGCVLCGADLPVIIYPSLRESREIDKNEFRSSGDEALKDPLVKCSSCGFEYVTPRIKSSLAFEGYSNTIDETFTSQAVAREKTFKKCLNIIQRHWNKKPGKILDVGTANGSFLKVAKDAGWDVEGCEPNKWMVEWCKKNYGIEIVNGTIFDGKFKDGQFDIVTLWDVLEHTPNPVDALKECLRVLKHDGLLVINYPDIGAWISRLMGRKWVFLLSVHYFYFTRKTIRKALAKTGFNILKIKPHYQTLELDYILVRATPYAKHIAKVLRSLVNGIGIGKIQFPYWIGQTLVVAKKSEKR
jgi:2-polyprenyl-3-methyl-5-hydroxy-6-metoxy-1,4-benzoquinol methylase